jgi:ADP-ribose pyrophosphatase YjhB (NUDIX family)
MEKFHEAFGVYGIITKAQQLAVIKKTGGPYRNRYDLPGGTPENGEELQQTLQREIKEETSLSIKRFHQLGITGFRYPWDYQQWHWNQHLCVFNWIDSYTGQIADNVAQFAGQDALGALWLPLDQISLTTCSPLVVKAAQTIIQNGQFDATEQNFAHWTVLTTPVY